MAGETGFAGQDEQGLGLAVMDAGCSHIDAQWCLNNKPTATCRGIDDLGNRATDILLYCLHRHASCESSA